MKFNELQLTAHHRSKRLGRGISSGKGKTAARGTKGQGARTGARKRPGFTGGQNPLMQQLPKLPGFASLRAKAANVHLRQLAGLKQTTVDNQLLAEQGLVASPYQRVKLLSDATSLTRALTVKLQGASKTAVAALEAAGGSFEAVEQPKRPASTKRGKA